MTRLHAACATALLLVACATASPPPTATAAPASDEDLAAARTACANVPTGPDRDRCIDVQVRRARGARNTY